MATALAASSLPPTALNRPNGQWSLIVVNRDEENAHRVRIVFRRGENSAASFSGPVEIATFDSGQYKWNPPLTRFMAHAEVSGAPTVVAYTNGTADPDGPIRIRSRMRQKTRFTICRAAPVVVIRGTISGH